MMPPHENLQTIESSQFTVIASLSIMYGLERLYRGNSILYQGFRNLLCVDNIRSNHLETAICNLDEVWITTGCACLGKTERSGVKLGPPFK